MTDRLAGKVAIADIIEPAAGLTNGEVAFHLMRSSLSETDWSHGVSHDRQIRPD